MKNLYLKLIIATFLLSISLFAGSVENNKTIIKSSSSDMCKKLYRNKLKDIEKNGWGNRSKTENSCILKIEKEDIPNILNAIDKIKTLKSSKEFYKKIPREAIRKLFLYIKYLEANDREDEALPIYLSLIKLANIKNPDVVLIAIKLNIDNRLIESLNEAFKRGLYSKDNKLLLYRELSKSLIVDNSLILVAFDNERDEVVKLAAKGFKDSLKSNKKESREVLDIYNSYIKDFAYKQYQKIKIAFIKNDFKELEKEARKDRDMLDSKIKMAKFGAKVALLQVPINIKRKFGLKVTKKEYYDLFDVMLKPLLNTVLPSNMLKGLSKNYHKAIIDNKKFLSKLKESIDEPKK